MNELRCDKCGKLLLKYQVAELEIKCPRCGYLMRTKIQTVRGNTGYKGSNKDRRERINNIRGEAERLDKALRNEAAIRGRGHQ